jgi:hypothetical protein
MVELDGRTVTCHSVCPEYKEASAKRDENIPPEMDGSGFGLNTFGNSRKDLILWEYLRKSRDANTTRNSLGNIEKAITGRWMQKLVYLEIILIS